MKSCLRYGDEQMLNITCISISLHFAVSLYKQYKKSQARDAF